MKDKTIEYVLRTTWMAIQKMYNEEAAKFDSTMATGFTLLSIDPEEGTPSTSLGPKMGMEATSLSRILKSMEERGLIERKPNPNDGRSVLIHLTQFGKEKREYSRDRVLIFNEAIRGKLPKEKIDHFYEVAQVINEMISNRKIYINNQFEIKDEHKKN
ncbi:MAG: MarR family transcriptional regulator [Bacteroidia bacterium]|nr:MarR family transcriptional regulator [Bacteroidia bacterium]MBT8267832.1 MarR family transcriptional regulator [Bacteroidia bacterium]NNF81521.1 MarR family transcriptional regulator [Flavobacteriaceae bacterium]NNK70178.1 MarR family transcriptional regulator [Flavobacteriaceae bacterium]NNL81577.1 MarR family transcriptional regulator [Flavobacteriaceae bacterium]